MHALEVIVALNKRAAEKEERERDDAAHPNCRPGDEGAFSFQIHEGSHIKG